MLQRPQDRSNPTGRRDLSKEMTPLLMVNGIIVLALLALALSAPSASEWISAAVQAEFVGSNGPLMTPTQIAQPIEATRTIRSN